MKSHLLSNTPIHKVWMGMNKRCNNPKAQFYHRYGGRGIKVCERWKLFENFYADMAPTYLPGLSIERKNNDGNYEPDNCVWATRKEQVTNRSTSRFLTCKGVTATLSEFSKISGTNDTTIYNRLKAGWPVHDAIYAPKGTTLKKLRKYETN